MPFIKRLMVAAFALCVGVAEAQAPADLPALNLLMQKFHSAYRMKDRDGILALWSEQSPQRAEQRDELEKLFADNAASEIRQVSVGEPDMAGDRARVRVDREFLRAPDNPSASVKDRFVLECVQEPGGWKVWKQTPAVENLADRLAASRTPEEQQLLLSTNTDLNGSELAFAVLEHGHQDLSHGDLNRALAIFQLVLTMTEGAGADSARARALSDVGQVRYNQGDIHEAMDWFQKSLALGQTIHDDRTAARALNNIGSVYKDEGESALAIECFEKDLVLGDKLHDDRVIFNAVGNLGIVYTQRGDYVQAFSYTKRAENLAEHFDKAARALVSMNMGQIFERQGDYEQAESYARRALEFAEAASDRVKMAVAVANLGTANQFRGDLAGALVNFEKSRAISEAIGARGLAAVALTHMGTVHLARREYGEAIALFEKSLRIQEELGDRESILMTILDLAAAQNRNGDFAEALHLATRALEETRDGPWIQPAWRAHLQAGNAYRGLKQTASAEAQFLSLRKNPSFQHPFYWAPFIVIGAALN